MGLLDRFRTSKPPTTRPRGESGRGHIDGYLQLEELNADLAGTRGLEVFDKMYRSDPDVRKNLWMIINLLVGATWTVQPYGGDDAEESDRKAADFVTWALFENMRPNWKGHLAQALPVGLRSGFAPFEHLWETTEWDGREVIAPRMLDLRLPRTIDRWHQRDGQLTAVQQQLISGSATIPMTDLLYYRFGAEGDNWEGTSLLRPAYKPWLLKDKIERLDAIKQERQAVGVPVCYPPKQASPSQREAMEEILINLRSGEQAFVMMPGPRADTMDAEVAQEHGWTLEILGHKQTESSDTKPSLDYHSDKIAAALLAEFMRLGQGSAPGGARATADVQQNPFMQAAEALSSEVEAVVNDGLVARMVALNFEVEAPPRLVMSLVDSTSLNDLADYVSKLVEKGALKTDDELEDFLRDRADLPPASAEARKLEPEQPKEPAETEPPEPEPEAPPASETEPAKPKATSPDATPSPEPALKPRWGRELREWEQLMCLEQLDTAINGARERFEAAGKEEAQTLVKKFVAAAERGDLELPKAGGGLERAIYKELQSLFLTGQATVEQELEAQRIDLTKVTPGRVFEDSAADELKRRAKLAATSIAQRIWRAVNTGRLLGSSTASVQEAGEREAAAALRAEAQAHASGALNSGRLATAVAHAAEIRGARYTSILDSNRCDSCRAADDDVLRPLDDPIRLSRRPPNQNCHGGGRCRCMEFYELEDESPGNPGGGGGLPPTGPRPLGGGGDAADHFDITGTDPSTVDLVTDQLLAMDSVHSMPSGLPRIPMQVRPFADSSQLGKWTAARFDPYSETWVDERIAINRSALLADPPLPSIVHEAAHHMDLNGFGNGITSRQVAAEIYTSSQPELSAWRTATANSPSVEQLRTRLSQATETSEIRRLEYLLKPHEVFARSYEQWIAHRSGNRALLRKIEARRQGEPGVYWTSAEFEPIAQAFDEYFAAKGLLTRRG